MPANLGHQLAVSALTRQDMHPGFESHGEQERFVPERVDIGLDPRIRGMNAPIWESTATPYSSHPATDHPGSKQSQPPNHKGITQAHGEASSSRAGASSAGGP